MDERKLNFNAPLLSVRRSSARTAASSNGEKTKKNENSQRSRRFNLYSCKAESNLDQVTEPVAVPFHWEKIPGRPKDGGLPDSHDREEASVIPRFLIEHKKPEDLDAFRPEIEEDSFVDRLDCSKDEANEKAIIIFENYRNDDDDDDDDVYSDALDTLSAADSFSVNCSVSGVSGFNNRAVKPSGTFAADEQTRDFMMSRFLPAAKAMTLEQPQYASRKKPVSGELPRQITTVVHRARTPPVTRKESLNIVPYHYQDLEDEESDEEGEDDYSDYGNITTKGCGLLPRLCIKNSLSLLNPVPGMKLRIQNSLSSSRDSHDTKKLNKAAFARSQSPTIKRPAKDAVSKPKSGNDGRSPKLAENKIACGSNRFNFASDRQMMSRTSPFRRSAGISPYRNEQSQSPFRGGGYRGVPKELESFKASKLNSFKGYSKSQELVPYHAIRRSSRPMSPTVEKTLYVDTVNVAGILSSNAGSSYMKKGSAGKDIKARLKNREIQETAAVEMSPDRGQADLGEDLSKESKALVCISAGADDNVDIGSDQISNKDDNVDAKTSLIVSPLPPLLPKTPSDSWLWRTLPSISSQNPSSHLYRGASFQSKRQDPKISSSASTKWENIVKSSYLHHDHVRYSEELFLHASQQSKS